MKDVLQMDLLVATFPSSNLMDWNTSTASRPKKGAALHPAACSPG
jgi:hypothetical protein